MKQVYLLIGLFLILSAGCGEGTNESTSGDSKNTEQGQEIRVSDPGAVPKQDRLDAIARLEEELKAGGDQPDRKVARKLMGEYLDFYNFQHDEPETPDFLYRAGELANYIERPKKAVEIYRNLFEGFPDYPKRVETLNLIAFVYDYELNDKDKARKSYELLIELYPRHKLAEDAKARLETIDLSDEELIKLFESRNQNP